MKIIIPLVLVVLFAFGCAQAPVATSPFMATLEPGCVQSKTAGHSYQSAVDPKVIFDTWIEVPALRKGDRKLMIVSYRNPDSDSDFSVAILVVLAGFPEGFSYLQNWKPKVFLYDRKTKCYREARVPEEHLKVFLIDLLKILNGRRI